MDKARLRFCGVAVLRPAFFIGAYAPIRDLLNLAILAAAIDASADLVRRRKKLLVGQSGPDLVGQAERAILPCSYAKNGIIWIDASECDIF